MNGDKYRAFFYGGFPDGSLSLDFSKTPINDVLVNGKSVVKNHVATINDVNGGKKVTDLYKVCKYLYEVRYDDLDDDFANEYFKKYKPAGYGSVVMKPFGCSSIRVGNFYGRNFDFYYNNDCSFIVRTTRKNGRNASIGVGSVFEKLDDKFVESGKYSDEYKLLPFMLVDGINEHGLVVNINVVTVEDEPTTGTTPTCKKKGEISMMAMPRFILDHYKTAKEAIMDIEAHYSVYAYNASAIHGSELHFMIADENETYLVEFVKNKLVYEKLGAEHPAIMTNFYTIGTRLLDGKIDECPENRSGVALLGCGIERYNKLIDRLNIINSKDSMVDAMKNIWYSKSYNPENKMYTEMVGLPDRVEPGKILTVESPRNHYEPTLINAKAAWEQRDRNQGIMGVWHTTHTSVYDIKNRKLYFHLQEDEIEPKEFEFEFREKIQLT